MSSYIDDTELSRLKHRVLQDFSFSEMLFFPFSDRLMALRLSCVLMQDAFFFRGIPRNVFPVSSAWSKAAASAG